MGFLDSFFKPTQQTTSTKVKLPKWLASASKDTLGRATSESYTPYVQFPGSRVAGFSPDQMGAQDFLRTLDPNLAGGAAAAGTAPMQLEAIPRLIDAIPGMSGGAAGTLDDYMNPYVGNVIQKTLDDMARQGEMQRNEIGSAATMAGAYGDARHGVLEAEQMRNEMDRMGAYSNQAWAQAFNNAMGLREADISRILPMFQANVGAMEQGLGRNISGQSSVLDDYLQYAGALGTSGAQQQLQEQRGLDVDYEDFLTEQGWDKNQISWLMSMMGQTPHGQTTTSTQPGASPAAQSLSVGASMLPFFFL